MGRDLAEETQHPPLVAALLLAVREVEGAPGGLERIVPTAGPEVGLPEVGELERMVAGAGRRRVGQCLLQEGHALEERRMHAPVATQQARLVTVLRGHYPYYGLPSNWHRLDSLYDAVRRCWYRVLRRRPVGATMVRRAGHTE